MITVRFPSMLHARTGRELTLDESPESITALVQLLDARVPGLAAELDDSIYNFAINDELVLHNVSGRSLQDGDVVEIVPAIAGG